MGNIKSKNTENTVVADYETIKDPIVASFISDNVMTGLIKGLRLISEEDAIKAVLMAEESSKDTASKSFCDTMDACFHCKEDCTSDKCVGYINFKQRLG